MDTNTDKMTRERISSFLDGELDASQHEQAFVALRTVEARSDWELYHQIGDVLRSDDMSVQLTQTFSTGMAARLEAEPVFIAPSVKLGASDGARKRPRMLRSMVAAAGIAMFAFVATPQLMVALKGDTGADPVIAAAPPAEVVAAIVPEGVILRDPRIDDYLLAHQRFSPSVYSSAQYVRSTTLSGK